MNFHELYQTFVSRLLNLDFQQYALLVVVIVAIGFYCMRGFGSRHNY